MIDTDSGIVSSPPPSLLFTKKQPVMKVQPCSVNGKAEKGVGAQHWNQHLSDTDPMQWGAKKYSSLCSSRFSPAQWSLETVMLVKKTVVV